MNFDDDLRDALRRQPAPPDFAAKVLAKAAREKGAVQPIWRRPLTLALAAGLLVAALLPPAISDYHHREEARALEARRQLMIALRITRTQLRQAQRKVNHPVRHTL
jgi:hypothetical protein